METGTRHRSQTIYHDSNIPQLAEQSQNRQQLADDFKILFSIPWDHHCRIITKCKGNLDKALFFVRKTWENNWGQLSFYVSTINHLFKTDIDNPTIGLLICKDKDNVVAKYALESYKEPMGISEYQLSKLFPKDFKSSMPTIEELENRLKNNN
ncbi:PDDEXK nuclease domain-containing protein [Prevotella sp.]|uniref:PDDEXK nuclease domain-containing protein n=1 Tax=Prevotella sp. TaxID=59823 RepID=UPI00402A51F1